MVDSKGIEVFFFFFNREKEIDVRTYNFIGRLCRVLNIRCSKYGFGILKFYILFIFFKNFLKGECLVY